MYKIGVKDDSFTLQKQGRFGKWIWLDTCGAWCNWFGQEHPRLFPTYEAVKDFIVNDCAVLSPAVEVIRYLNK
jgi:hypothetical protein